jgi:3-oxoacyl-[acyl-carrier protein] reductase
MALSTRRVAFVTGGSRGIGAAIVRALAEDGFSVAFTYVRNETAANAIADGLKAGGRDVVAIQADSSDTDSLVQAIEKTIKTFGRLDVLVNNAGIFMTTPIDEVSAAEIDHSLAVNTRSVLVASQAAARHMQPGSRIISIGSNLAERVPFPGLTVYSMTKAALIGMTKGLARDYGPRGITVNLVQPGSTDTDMNPADGEHASAQAALTALGGFGEPQDIAAMVAFLAGNGGRQITGALVTVDGGTNA